MSTDLVVTQPQIPQTGLALAGQGFEGITIKPSNMELVQRTSRAADAIPGKFRDTQSNNYFETLQIVPLHRQVKRVYFPPGADLGAEPICKSQDGIVPSQFALAAKSDTCANCEFGDKMWKTYKQTGKKPECQLVWELLFVLRDTMLPYRMNFKGMAIAPLRNLLEQVYKDVIVARSKGENPNLFEYTMEMFPVATSGKKGSYYTPGFRKLARIKPEDRAAFGPAYEMFVLRYRQAEASAESDATIEQGMNGGTEETTFVEA